MDSLFGEAVKDEVDELVEVLWLTPGWPRDPVKDRALMHELRQQFPEKDLADELGAWRVWLIAKGKREMVTSRGRWSRVRNWCTGRFAGQGTSARGTSATQRRARTAARPAAAFGDSSVSLGRW